MSTAYDREQIREGLRPVFQRMVNAHDSFIAELVEQFGLTKDQAEHVLAIFRKAKAVKLDLPMGRYALTHGAYWDAQVIQNALAMPKPKQAKRKG